MLCQVVYHAVLCLHTLLLFRLCQLITCIVFSDTSSLVWVFPLWFSSVQLFSYVRLFADLMDYSMPGFPVLHHLPEFFQTHVILWCHPTISFSIIPFSSCLQSFPASGSFQTSQFFASGGKSIGASASASVLPMNIQDWFPLGWTGWISLQSKGLSRVFSSTTVQQHQFFSAQLSL